MLTIIHQTALRWIEEYRRRAQLRSLLAKDDRMLQDIGLTRHDVEAALGQPMEVDARAYARKHAAATFAFDRQ